MLHPLPRLSPPIRHRAFNHLRSTARLSSATADHYASLTSSSPPPPLLSPLHPPHTITTPIPTLHPPRHTQITPLPPRRTENAAANFPPKTIHNRSGLEDEAS